jgi:hypothetical protein
LLGRAETPMISARVTTLIDDARWLSGRRR